MTRHPEPRWELWPAATSTLLAVVAEEQAHGRATVRGVADRLQQSPSTVHNQLRRLRLRGYVDWEPGKAGTLRPLVRQVGPRAE